MPRLSPDLLLWARETAGLNLEEAARKLAIRPARGLSGSERLAALEDGTDSPSRSLLRRMAKAYRRSLVLFYMESPPRRGNRGMDFRTLAEDEGAEQGALIDALLRDVRARHDLLRSALEEEDLAARPFVGSARGSEPPRSLADSIREALRVRLSDFRRRRGAEDAFDYLRHQAESVGLFVVLIHDLGSHHTAVDVSAFRGFAIADTIAPLVVINDQDAKAALSFTLIHELTHIWLGQTGVSGADFSQDIEAYCNDVASEFLLPSSDLAEWQSVRGDTDLELSRRITSFANERNISRSLVLYRLLRSGAVSRPEWERLSRNFREEWIGLRRRLREEGREREGGPNFYTIRRHRLGQALLQTTTSLLESGALTSAKAARVLGVKPTQLTALLAHRTAAASI